VKEQTKKILGIYLGLFFGEAICISAFYIEVGRALGGNSLSWAYVFEWPFFAGYLIYMARRLIRDERTPPSTTTSLSSQSDDPALVAWNNYLFEVHGGRSGNEETSQGGGP
jgi:hypothetical protein